jgi:DNA-binding Lrp family transcriptional regulator
MGEDRFEMSQRERDRLKVLHEAGKGAITQKQASEQLRITERQVRRLLKKIRTEGDRAVVHGLRNRPSNRRIAPEIQQQVIEELSRPECLDFRTDLRGGAHCASGEGEHRARHRQQMDVSSWLMEE